MKSFEPSYEKPPISLETLAGRTYSGCGRLFAASIRLVRQRAMGSDPSNFDDLVTLERLQAIESVEAPKAVLLREAATLVPDPQAQSNLLFVVGVLMEQQRDFEAAVFFYWDALQRVPQDLTLRYFTLNNLGFSLNQLQRFEEGYFYCQEAIKVDPCKPNAHKNCGLADWGLGRLREAALCFVRATDANLKDRRSADHLQDLLRKHADLRSEFEFEMQRCLILAAEDRRGWSSAN